MNEKTGMKKSGVLLTLLGIAVVVAVAFLLFLYNNSDSNSLKSIMERYTEEYKLKYKDLDTIYVSTLKDAGYDLGLEENCLNSSYVIVHVDDKGKYSFELVKVCSNDEIIIILKGDARIKLEFGTKYVELGATATLDGSDISSLIKIIDNINYNKLGSYAVTYTVTKNGKETKATRNVEIVDTTAPSLVLKGSREISVVVGTKFKDPGYQAIDKYDGNLTEKVTVEGNVNTNKVGSYTLTYSVSDSSGNSTSVKRTVRVVEPTNPTLSLNGFSVEYVNYPAIYIEKGYQAFDQLDGNITSKVVVTGNVNSAVLGTYNITYKVTNSYNKTTTVNRTVIVRDITKPVITLSGTGAIILNLGDTYVEPGYGATDNYDGDLTSQVQVTTDLNTNATGIYFITYSVSDSSGNTATEQRKVTVVDTIAPVITLIGNDVVLVEVFGEYEELGATVTDNYDQGLSVRITGTVNTSIPGTYTIYYNATDLSGNAAVEVTRTVIVQDTTAPVITVVPEVVNLYEGDSYNLMTGVIAVDNYDGDITDQVIITGSIDFDTAGIYTVKYNVKDSFNNNAIEVIRTINVYDKNTPFITLNGEAIIYLEVLTEYIELGAIVTDAVDNDLTVTISGVVDTDTLGEYIVKYNATNSLGRPAPEVERKVIVQDTTPPEITVDEDLIVIDEGTPFDVMNGVEASDNYDGVITIGIIVVETPTFNYNVPGTYYITYNIADSSGNAATEATRSIIVRDITAPVIELNGESTIYIEIDEIYNELGATVTDNVDTNLVVTISGDVDTSAVGTYYVYYNSVDSSGNVATEVVRTVIVQNTIFPEIRIEEETVTIDEGTPYNIMEGVSASDERDGDITSLIVPSSEPEFDYNTPGTYIVKYNVTNSKGNEAPEVTRTIIVKDTTAPVINLVGETVIYLEVGSVFTDPGAVVVDNVDRDLEVTVTGLVDPLMVDIYYLYYNATDSSGNAAIEVTRTIHVVDKTALRGVTAIADSKEEIDYTEGSWEAFLAARVIADAMPENTQIEINAKTNALIEAISLLEIKVTVIDKSLLNAVKSAASAKVEANYTENSWDAFQLALNEAIILPETTQIEIDAKTAAIVEAIALLEAKTGVIDKSVLNAVKTAIEAKVESDYISNSWEAFQIAVAEGLAMPEATQIEIDAKTVTLVEAISLLVANQNIIDKALLNAAKLAALAKIETDYTPESWTLFIDAKTEAFALPETTQVEVNNKTRAITDAIDLLVALNKTNLNAAKTEAKAKKENAYSATSWSAFITALNTALAMPEVTQANIDAKTDAIKVAIELLVMLDKTELKAVKNDALSKNEADYVPASWLLFREELEKALAMPQTEQSEIDAKVAAIKEAIELLEPIEDDTEEEN